jgi:hypothetical protein
VRVLSAAAPPTRFAEVSGAPRCGHPHAALAGAVGSCNYLEACCCLAGWGLATSARQVSTQVLEATKTVIAVVHDGVRGQTSLGWWTIEFMYM